MEIRYVKWLDAVGCAQGWNDQLSLKDVEGEIESVGFVLDENEKFVLLAGHHGGDQVQGDVAIPHAMILEQFEIELAPE